MKYYIGLLALIAVALAAPVDVEEPLENAEFSMNSTRAAERILGFGNMGGWNNGGMGGPVWTVWDANAFRNALNSNERRYVRVMGRIDMTTVFTGSPGVRFNVGRYTTVVGGNRNAEIIGGGLRISNNWQVQIRNIRFNNALSFAPGERPNGNGGIANQVNGEFSEIDAIEVSNSVHVWIDHCEFSDDPWNAANTPANRRRHDGLIDIVRGSNYVTVSNSIFRNHNHVALIGNGDGVTSDNGRLKVTYFANWFRGTNQRNPRVRFGEVHVLNNLYTDITSYGIGVGVSARIFAERNVFVNCRRGWGWAAGVPNPMGYLHNEVNTFRNSGHDSGIPNSGVRWRPWQYYQYRAIPIGDVENHVRRYAGIW